jgi:mediator of RNA polymerase II transcription subunit 27
LEESGVLNGALKARGNSWGLHMPLVCPDGAVVAYAWKRQLAGQAGASAVDRTR